MRIFLTLAFLLPGAALADTVVATSRVTAVTIYPQGAEVVRQVRFTAPAGEHEVLVLDLPEEVQAEGLRVTSGDVALGAFALRSDRLPPRDEMQTPEGLAAEAAVKATRAALRQAEAGQAGIAAEIEAQEVRIGFLTAVQAPEGAATAEALAALSRMIGAEVLAARQAALAAAARLPEAEEAVAEAQEDLDQAEAALEALAQRADSYQALAVAVTGTGAEAVLTITHFTYGSSWTPVYDMALDRKAGRVAVSRGVLVTQYSGEDWLGVDLTLSTAQPGNQADPSQLWPWLRRIEDPVPLEETDRVAKADAGMAEAVMAPEAAMMIGSSAVAGFQGDTVVYHYPRPVDLASGVENLRLKLDELVLSARIVAQAVPRADRTGFLVASVTNGSAELLLPGQVFLYRDGALIGGRTLEILAPGAEVDLGFGAIEGLRLKRDMPQRAEGERGIISTSNQIEEQAVLEVENLTDETWPVRVLDQVPYSEQEELEISFRAEPPVSEEDVKGARGILAWDFDLAPGETRTIRLDSVIAWPEGKVLQ